ncbi:MAG: glycoside hydrolase family 3 C-terminal domain-containing protein [Bacteroidetes bacterium]|nr:glycoside hydrolase family 3 C-terminal domain-containing protein [Bacteroidota bacterium]
MNLKFLSLNIGVMLLSVEAGAQQRFVDVDALIARMSLEEKIGQMTQIDLGVIARGSICNLEKPQNLDSQKLTTAISMYHIGSVLNVGCGSGAMSLERWRSIVRQIHRENQRLSRLNIPIIYGIDAIHGANYTLGSTLFPQQIGLAATWDTALVRKVFAASAYETRAAGTPWNFSPVLDLARQPLWSRFFETFGADVHLSSSMATAAIKGLQGDNPASPYHVAACMKHFLGYGFPLSGKDRTPAWIPDRELRAYFAPPFQAAIKQGAMSVMINSGAINGIPVHANADIMSGLLRREMGFEGVAISDWEDIQKLLNVHHVAADLKDAVRMSIEAGLDMSMTPNDFAFCDLLAELVREGRISERRLDSSVRRILIMKARLGLFDTTIFGDEIYPDFGSEKHKNLSFEAAAASLTLLKNNADVLPLKNKERVFVCGPAAHSMHLLNGAWSRTWQGNDTSFHHDNRKTIAASLRNYLGPERVLDDAACADRKSLLRMAAKSDKIVVCLAEDPGTEIPGNIDDLNLPRAQQELVTALSKLGKPIILVCCFGRPRIIHETAKQAEGILYAYLPGDEGGRAIAACITGRINPSGRLPFTYPRTANEFVNYDHTASEEIHTDFSNTAYRPEFDFGAGLSYTRFRCDTMVVSQEALGDGDSVEVRVQISNTGNKSGTETVQLYYRDPVASITPAVKKLIAFRKISLEPQTRGTLRFVLYKEDFALVNRNLKKIAEPGIITLQVDRFKHDINIH